jgi:hypothetical protein
MSAGSRELRRHFANPVFGKQAVFPTRRSSPRTSDRSIATETPTDLSIAMRDRQWCLEESLVHLRTALHLLCTATPLIMVGTDSAVTRAANLNLLPCMRCAPLDRVANPACGRRAPRRPRFRNSYSLLQTERGTLDGMHTARSRSTTPISLLIQKYSRLLGRTPTDSTTGISRHATPGPDAKAHPMAHGQRA